MPAPPNCPACGTRLPTDVPEGVCPVCDLRGALAEDRSEGGEVGGGDIDFDLPRQFGDYELLEIAGHGGMGIVYKARQLSLNRTVAVKLLPLGALSNPTFVKRFKAEAAAAGGLQHPNIVTVHEVGLHQNQHYLVMNFVSGPPLSRLVSHGALPARKAAQYLRIVADAVQHAHEHGILHRDLKPSNVLINDDDQPLVTDFGLAKHLDKESSLTLTGHVLGSPNYMPPEQASSARGRVSRCTDVYGLGATLYHLLTGRPPFQAETLSEAIQQVMNIEPIAPRLLNPGIPPDLETICLKCLEKEPRRRYATAQAVSQELGRFLQGEPVLARRIGMPGKAWRWCRRRPALSALGLALVVTLATGLIGIVWQWRQALANEQLARQNAYAADIHQAQSSLADGDFGSALHLLQKYHPNQPSHRAGQSSTSPDLRNWEWRYLWQLCRSDEEFMLCRYDTWVGALAISRDGRHLALRKGDGVIALWDLNAREELANFPAPSTFWGGLAIAPNSGRLAAGIYEAGTPPSVNLWDLNTKTLITRFLHELEVRSVAFSPDEELLATRDSRATVRLWDIKSGQVLMDYNSDPNQEDASTSDVLAFSPDGRWLAFQDQFSAVRVLDWRTKQTVLLLRPEHPTATRKNPVTTIAFSPKGSWLAWAMADTTIRLWNLAEERDGGILQGHKDWILSLAFTPDERHLVSASGDQTIRVWNAIERRALRILRGNEYEVWALGFMPDGRTLVSGGKDGTVRFWDINKPTERIATRTLPISSARFMPDVSHVVSSSRDGTVHVWDPLTAREINTIPGFKTNSVLCAVAADARLLAMQERDSHLLSIWNWETGKLRQQMPVPWKVSYARFSPSGRHLLAGIRPMSLKGANLPTAFLKLWRTHSAEDLQIEAVLDGTPNTADIGKDDVLMAVGDERGTITLVSIPQKRIVATLDGHPSQVEIVRFSGDGRRLASAGYDDFVKVWDVRTGRELMTLRSHFTHTTSLAFSPDNQRLAVGGVGGGAGETGNAVELWDLATERGMLTLDGGAIGVTFSPDGKVLAASTFGNRETLFWHAPSWDQIQAADQER